MKLPLWLTTGCILLTLAPGALAEGGTPWAYKNISAIQSLAQIALETDPILAPHFAKHPLCAYEPAHITGNIFSGTFTCYSKYDEGKPEGNIAIVSATYGGNRIPDEPALKLPPGKYCTDPLYTASIYGLAVRMSCNDTFINEALTETSTTYNLTVAVAIPQTSATVDIEKLYWEQPDLIIIDDTK